MKFGKLRKPLFLFCLLTSVGLHVALFFLFFRVPFSYAESNKGPIFKASNSPQIHPVDREELLVERIEHALEESLNQIIAMTGDERPQGYLAEQKIDEETVKEEAPPLEKKKVAERPSRLASAAKIQEEQLLALEELEHAFALQLPPPFNPEQEELLSDFALDEAPEENPFQYESEAVSSVDFAKEIAPASPISSLPAAVHDDLEITTKNHLPETFAPEELSRIEPNLIANLKKLRTAADLDQYGDDWGEKELFKAQKENITTKLILPNSVNYLREEWMKRSVAEKKLPDIEHYGIEEMASTIEWENEVDIDIAYMPDREGHRYIFSLAIHPDFTFDGEPIAQNYYFLIDRSSSVEKHKFGRYKRAVQRALTSLKENDTFNILFFDKKIAKLSKENLAVTPKNLRRAEDFLERDLSRNLFAAGDIYSTLDQMIPDSQNSEELHSVILISDGNGLMSPSKQRRTITDWIAKKQGSINFYSAAAGRGNNLALLDLISYSTAGKMLYSDTNASFPRKLVRFVKDLGEPLVKNITVEIAPKDPTSTVKLHPIRAPLPPMFAERPYVLIGEIDELCDFTLFLQGKSRDGWLNIKKTISLKEGKRGGRTLEKQWSNIEIHNEYDQYLMNGKQAHLRTAKEIAAPLRGVIAMD